MYIQNATQYTCNPYIRRNVNGLKYVAYAYVVNVGLYFDNGEVAKGFDGHAITPNQIIPALATPTPKVCCGQRG